MPWRRWSPGKGDTLEWMWKTIPLGTLKSKLGGFRNIMPYNHSRKAGNQGDVWKHFLLLSALAETLRPGAKYLYRESHAGASAHILPERGEWRRGIMRS